MWPFRRIQLPPAPAIPPPKASEHLTNFLRDTNERLAILEGNVSGLRASLEGVAESLVKATAKWNARTRQEAKDAREVPEPDNGDPRIMALRKERGLAR